MSKLREDVDGLRAVAALLVVMYHYDHELVPGGFVGVSVFFALSGYFLALGILGKADFNFKEFLARRQLRLLPSCFLIIFAVVIASMNFHHVQILHGVLASALASCLGLVNVYFWQTQDMGYFASDVKITEPLLHLWSLGVEEQFSVVFPLIFLAIWKRGVIFASGVIFCFVVLCAIFGTIHGSTATYYLLYYRAGEFLCGTLIAMFEHERWLMFVRNSNEKIKALLKVLAFAVILYCSMSFNASTSYPSWRALVPSSATAGIIALGNVPNSLVDAILTDFSLVWIGKLSFAIYLIHWPVLSFMRYLHWNIPFQNFWIIILAIFILGMLAFALNRGIEETCRRQHYELKWILLVRFSIVGCFLILIFLTSFMNGGHFLVPTSTSGKSAVFLKADKGTSISHIDASKPWLQYFHDEENAKKLRLRWRKSPKSIEWFVPSSSDFAVSRGRIAGKLGGDGRPQVESRIALIGDSYAQQLFVLADAMGLEHGWKIWFLPITTVCSNQLEWCDQSRNDMKLSVEEVLDMMNDFPSFVLAGYWRRWMGQSAIFVSKIVAEAKKRSKRVLLIGELPRFDSWNAACVESTCKTLVSSRASVKNVNSMLKSIALSSSGWAYYWDLLSYICKADECFSGDDQGPFLYNPNHLNSASAARLALKVLEEEGGLPFAWSAALNRTV